MNKRLISLPAVCVAASMVLTACGSSDSSQSAETIAETTATVEAAAAVEAEESEEAVEAEETVETEVAVETEEAVETVEDVSDSADEEIEYITVDVETTEEGEIILEDYSTIEIPASSVSVSDSEIESYIDSIISAGTTTEQITEGTAQEGDTVNIDFSGTLEGAEEPFEGGTSQGYDLVLGSGSFIDGFEDQIIGHEIGETFDIQVTFPEEYGSEELAGQNAVFTITLNYKTITIIPELTDEFISEFSSSNMSEQIDTVDALNEYVYNYLYDDRLQTAIMTVMAEKETIVTYQEENFNILVDYAMSELTYYANQYAMYGMDWDEDYLAQMSGYATAEDYAKDEAKYYMQMVMMMDQIAADQNITVSEEELDAAISAYIESNNLTDYYTVEGLKETDLGFTLLMEKLQVLYLKNMEVLRTFVVVVDDVETVQETEAVEENASEMESELETETEEVSE